MLENHLNGKQRTLVRIISWLLEAQLSASFHCNIKRFEVKHFNIFSSYKKRNIKLEVYLEPCQRSIVKQFGENSQWLLAVNSLVPGGSKRSYALK